MSSSLFALTNKTAVVTGGSRGLGLYAATGLLQAGVSTLVITSRKAAACDAAVKDLQRQFPSARVFAIPADLSKASEVSRFVSELKDSHGVGAVHILIANAGATWGAPFDSYPDSGFEKVLNLNVRSVFNLIRDMAPLLEAAGTKEDPARVVTVGSVIGIQIGPTGGNMGTYAYAASKAAVMHLSKYLAVELGPRKILVNCILPGFFVTDMARELIKRLGGEEAMGASAPNKRLGKAEDIQGLITFLCSKAASHINGAAIPLDGGKHLVLPKEENMQAKL